jgi:hypothetical protein
VVVVDAGSGTPAPYELREASPVADFSHTSHALSPEAVLATFERVTGTVSPETWVLCVRGEAFGWRTLSEPRHPRTWERLTQLLA